MRKIAENKTVAEAVKLLQEKPDSRVAVTNRKDKSRGFYLDQGRVWMALFDEEDEKPYKLTGWCPFMATELTDPVFTIYEQD